MSLSRYAYCWDITIQGKLRKLPRGFYRYQKLSDTVEHVCKEGETLWIIAATYYTGQFEKPSLLYWIIGDFQPEPILDPLHKFNAGDVVYVPSIKTILLNIFTPSREPEFETW